MRWNIHILGCKDSLFEKPLEITQQIYQENNPLSSEITNLIKESLERLNLPAYLYKFVVKSIQKNDKSLKLTKASVAHHLYTTLSEFNTPFTLKKICGVTGTPKNKISKEQKKSPSGDRRVELQELHLARQEQLLEQE